MEIFILHKFNFFYFIKYNGDNNSNNKNENDESFNYDLPLEMDKSSDFFNINQPQGKLIQCLNDINENTNFQEFNYNNIFINFFNKEKNLNKIPINIKKEKKKL